MPDKCRCFICGREVLNSDLWDGYSEYSIRCKKHIDYYPTKFSRDIRRINIARYKDTKSEVIGLIKERK